MTFGSAFGAKPAGTGLFGSTTTTGGFGGFGQPVNNQASTTGTTTGGLFGNNQQQQQPQQQSTGLFGQTQQPQQQTTGGLFGQQQQTQPSTGLFGQTQQQQQPATGGGLFGNTNTNTQPAGGLFGSTANNAQPAAAGLFGSTANNATNTNQPAGGGLFGSTATNQAGQTGGGLFGNTNTTNATGGLFGNTNTGANTGAGLFGNTNTNTATGGGLFGNNSANTANPGGGLFGSTATNQGTGGGLFGNTTNNQTGGGLFGTAPLQPQATQPAGTFGSGAFSLTKQPSQQPTQFGASTVQPSQPAFTKATKFNDLPESTRNLLESIESHIQGRVQISKELQQRKLGDEPTKGLHTIKQLHKQLADAQTTVRNDAHTTRDLKARVEQAVEDTIVATRIVDGFRNPGSANHYLKDHASFPHEFFTRIADEMKERLVWYKTTIEQIERKLSSSAQTQTPQGIVATLQAQHATFLALASKTAALDKEIQKIKAYYSQIWRAKTGSARDPFDSRKSAGPGDFGMSTLNVR